MALIAMTLGLTNLLVFVIAPMAVLRRGPTPLPYVGMLSFLFGVILPLLAIMLGSISLISISLSAGRLAGRNFALIGIVAPIAIFVVITFMSPLARCRSQAFRMTCGTNLSGMGKAMLIYANDYEDELPKAGARNNTWACSIPNWRALNRRDAYGISGSKGVGTTSIGSNFYLLVKYAEMTPDRFLCLNRKNAGTEFALSQFKGLDKGIELIDCWDFGPNPARHYDYAYHAPFGDHALTISSDPAMAVAADLNPWIQNRRGRSKDFAAFFPDEAPWQGTVEQARHGNSPLHQDGQNVLFLDSHVGFEKRSYCGKDKDNIYTQQKEEDRMRGTAPVPFNCRPSGAQDSLLLHDPPPSRESLR